MEMQSWTLPEVSELPGQYCTLKLLQPEYSDDLHRLANVEDHEERYKYLYGAPPPDRRAFDEWFDKLLHAMPSRFVFVVIDNSTGKAEGMQSFMNIVPQHGVLEIGGVLWGPQISRTATSTEAFFLFADYVFSKLKYRRLEWKCNNDNAGSKRAAERFGFSFEGIFRQHMLVNGENRDTAWYSIIDSEWPSLRGRFIAWLDKGNFDTDGRQIKTIQSFRF